jgi:chorismate mutase
MSKNKPNLSMDQVRLEIDRVDTALLDLIAERMELAQAVRRAKSGMNLWRPSREESHVRHLADKAVDTSPELVSRIWAELTSASLSIQGPIGLHVALTGDVLFDGKMVRDRFGASIPIKNYPTASHALAAAHADPEGVAVLPAPGGMNNWWTALTPGGAASDMNILAALPRTGAWSWPTAVAVSKAAREPSGADQTLIYVEPGTMGPLKTVKSFFTNADLAPVLRADMKDHYLYSVPEFVDETSKAFGILKAGLKTVKIIGVLPDPIAVNR